jgi:predicted RNase H-like HicB family nuclease
MRYAGVIEAGEHNYSACVTDFPGWTATGTTLEDVKHMIREALAFHLEGLREDGEPIPGPTTVCAYIETQEVEERPRHDLQ